MAVRLRMEGSRGSDEGDERKVIQLTGAREQTTECLQEPSEQRFVSLSHIARTAALSAFPRVSEAVSERLLIRSSISVYKTERF
jgi:hypothetical protein